MYFTSCLKRAAPVLLFPFQTCLGGIKTTVDTPTLVYLHSCLSPLPTKLLCPSPCINKTTQILMYVRWNQEDTSSQLSGQISKIAPHPFARCEILTARYTDISPAEHTFNIYRKRLPAVTSQAGEVHL